MAFAPTGVMALRDEGNQGRWDKPAARGPDAEVPGFLVNMGPTGARGILQAQSFLVKHIFSGSPAHGVLQIGDEVHGANGRRFSAHSFGSRNHGLEGPIKDLGMAIENSEGGDGVLTLMVKRGDSDMQVEIQLEQLGRFADTFPANCEKTELLKQRANQYLVDNPGGLASQGRCVAILALLSSDDRRHHAAGVSMAKEWNRPMDENTWSWHLGFQGITLAEYHLLTGDRSVLGTLESTLGLLRRAQWQPPIRHWRAEQMRREADQATIDRHQALYAGGFGHAPYPFVVARGGGGYGPMQWPTCLAIMAWQLGRQSGIGLEDPEIDAGIDSAFQFLDYGTTEAGRIAYGGEFTLNNGPVDWVRWKANTNPGFSHKSGLGYLVFMLSPERSDSARMMNVHLANIHAAYKDMADGHACALMGLTWGWAGVYASDEDRLKKKVAENFIPWLNMARCHGSDSYVILPGRDYADESYYRDNIRNHTTASVAFLYSFSNPTLRVHGAGGAAGGAGKGGPLSMRVGEMRAFQSADRRRSIEGSLLSYDTASGVVRIRLRNGTVRELPFEMLSAEDQEYVKSPGSR